MLGNPAKNQISRNISKIKPKTRGNIAPIIAPKTAPAALTAAIPLKPSSGNASNRKKYAIGAAMLKRKAPNSAAKVLLIIFVFLVLCRDLERSDLLEGIGKFYALKISLPIDLIFLGNSSLEEQSLQKESKTLQPH